MSCTKPLIRAETWEKFKNKKGGTSYKTEFLNSDIMDNEQYELFVKKGIYRRIDMIPCGQCIECRLNYTRQWATRCMLEKKQGYQVGTNEKGKPIYKKYNENECWFLTFTYADEHLPTHVTVNTETGEKFEGVSVNKSDMQKFWKRERKNKKLDHLKYLQCGEYGKQTQRPHYHAIVFGYPLDRTKFKKMGNNEWGDATWVSEELEQWWGLGNVRIGEVTWESVAYVARYNLKKAFNKNDWWYASQGKAKEWVSMSKGLGTSYLEENIEMIYKSDSVPIRNKKTGTNVNPPLSYDRILKEVDPELYESIKRKRKQSQKAQTLLEDTNTDLTRTERRAIAEARMQSVIKDLRNEV